MRRNRWLWILVCLLLAPVAMLAADPTQKPSLRAKPDAFEALFGPDCSHCVVEAKRRKEELRPDDRVLCWRHVFQDGYTNDGAVPLRFFLSKHRILNDGWGVFVYDPDAGYARGYRPEGSFTFHGWRNGVMVMKGKDGTLYSGLTGIAFDGPKKGSRLQPRETLETEWGFWNERYPQALAYTMYDKYKPVELPTDVDEDSQNSRGPVDDRLPADTMVLGVWDGKHARAYPLDVLAKAEVLYDTAKVEPRVVFWYGPTRTAVAYRPAVFVQGQAPGYSGDGIFLVDPKGGPAPFVDKRTAGHWDITGRGAGGGPMLSWMDSVQVKWFAWAAEYPETSVYGQSSTALDAKPVSPQKTASTGAVRDYKPLTPDSGDRAGAHGNLDITARHFGILKAVDVQRQRIALLIEGQTEVRDWPLSSGAELWHDGWWGRLDQFTLGDRVWVWFEKDSTKQPVAVSLLADELSEQKLYLPFTIKSVIDVTLTVETVRDKPLVRTVNLCAAELYRGDGLSPHDSLKTGETIYLQTTSDNARLILDTAAFEKRHAAQKAELLNRWTDEGLPGTLIFSQQEPAELDLMLDHEAMQWGRSLQVGDKVTLQAGKGMPAVVRQVRPWRERTQVRLGLDCCSDPSALTIGQRVLLRLAAAPAAADADRVPTGLDRSRSKVERVEWLMSSIYCTCGMTDGCAGHVFTLAACNAGPIQPCGMAKRTREEVAEMIDKGKTDREIFEGLLQERGPDLLRPHLSPRKMDGGHK